MRFASLGRFFKFAYFKLVCGLRPPDVVVVRASFGCA
jgi:hypothetical protein